MKKLKLDASKLLLKKEKIASLSEGQMSKIMGGGPQTGNTNQNCCFVSEYATQCNCTGVNQDNTACGSAACASAVCASIAPICALSNACD